MTLPHHTMDDLITATGRSRRTLQHAVAQYELTTGHTLSRVKHRNFMALTFSPSEFDIFQRAVQFVATTQGTYQEFFKDLTGINPRSTTSMDAQVTIPAAEWLTFTARFTDLETEIQRQGQRADELVEQLAELLLKPGRQV